MGARFGEQNVGCFVSMSHCAWPVRSVSEEAGESLSGPLSQSRNLAKYSLSLLQLQEPEILYNSVFLWKTQIRMKEIIDYQ